MLSEDQLEKGIRNGWIVLIAYSKKTNLIVGCIISRSLGTLTHCSDFGKSWQLRSFQNTGFIDFFCVSELERKKGLVSHLLLCLDAYSSKKGRQIQFFQKEGLPLISLPPIWTGRYLSLQVKFKSDNNNISYLTNCDDGNFHQWIFVDDTMICKLCKKKYSHEVEPLKVTTPSVVTNKVL
jgi:hypothetical protein